MNSEPESWFDFAILPTNEIKSITSRKGAQAQSQASAIVERLAKKQPTKANRVVQLNPQHKVKDAVRIKPQEATAGLSQAQEDQAGWQPKKREPFTQEELEKAWVDYARELERMNVSRLLAANMLKNLPEKRSDEEIVLTLDHAAAEKSFQDYRTELLRWLQKSLHNDHLSLDYRIRAESEVADHEKAKAYTNRERLIQMIEKNPHLGELVKKLDLDVDV